MGVISSIEGGSVPVSHNKRSVTSVPVSTSIGGVISVLVSYKTEGVVSVPISYSKEIMTPVSVSSHKVCPLYPSFLVKKAWPLCLGVGSEKTFF